MNIPELLTILKFHNIHMTSKEIADIWGMDVAAFSRKKREGTQIKHKNIKQLEDELGISFLNKTENSRNKLLEIPRNVSIENWGERLCKIMSDNNITPYKLSKLTKTSEYLINQYILTSKEPSITFLNKIKSYFNINIDELLYGEIKNTPVKNSEEFTQTEVLELKNLLKNLKK